jgi:hypothetical protein
MRCHRERCSKARLNFSTQLRLVIRRRTIEALDHSSLTVPVLRVG